MDHHVCLLSALEKVFPTRTPAAPLSTNRFTMLQNDSFSFQIAVRAGKGDSFYPVRTTVTLESPIADCVSVRKVDCVPSMLPAYANSDGNYITVEPGLYPDLLSPLTDGSCVLTAGRWESLWIEVQSGELAAGTYPIDVVLALGEDVIHNKVEICVIGAELPKQKLMHTEWFYADCLANYYNTEVFSEQHWEAIEKQIALAGKRGVNMLLTPVFTPALDTKIGFDRRAVQLVDVYLNDGVYSFDFAKLDRWVEICLKHGIEYFEIAHFFTQWGAACCPQILVTENGETKNQFGWQVEATSEKYKTFIAAFVPALIQRFTELGVRDRLWFHISDEPWEEVLPNYNAAKEVVLPYLEGLPIMDALSHYAFYEQGVCDHPVVAADAVKPFIENNAENWWVYYCCAQGHEVPNRFMSMPLARTRIIAELLYQYKIPGFLHWGYNSYSALDGTMPIDPYYVTDAMRAFPSGDAFLVYPGANGEPLESLRMMAMADALCDLRAFELLESLSSREFVMELINEELAEPMTFFDYPKDPAYQLRLRQRVNAEIAARIA